MDVKNLRSQFQTQNQHNQYVKITPEGMNQKLARKHDSCITHFVPLCMFFEPIIATRCRAPELSPTYHELKAHWQPSHGGNWGSYAPVTLRSSAPGLRTWAGHLRFFLSAVAWPGKRKRKREEKKVGTRIQTTTERAHLLLLVGDHTSEQRPGLILRQIVFFHQNGDSIMDPFRNCVQFFIIVGIIVIALSSRVRLLFE
jgi:hypothetical protein